jgi:hypothetical protein
MGLIRHEVMHLDALQNERLFLKMRECGVMLAGVLSQRGQPRGNASDRDLGHLESGIDFAR